MYRTNTKMMGVCKLRNLLIAALVFVVSFGYTIAQTYPAVPVLSLTGRDGGYNDQWFPNGRILTPANNGYEREILVPVFIDNRWARNDNRYVVDLPVEPIKSFQFKLFYDSASVRPVGIETTHPKHIPLSATFDEPLADGFQIEWDDRVDKSYYTHIQAGNNTSNRGRAVVITASNNEPLPNTDLDFQSFKVLLYVRFKIVLSPNEVGPYQFTAFHIGRDTIVYNDMNILQEAPFVEYRDYDPQVALDFPDPQRPDYDSGPGAVFTGLAGMDNRQIGLAPNRVLPGVIWLDMFTSLPSFKFEINRQVGQQPPIRLVQGTNDLYELADPMTVDLNPNGNPQPYSDVATRDVEVLNGTESTLLKDIEIKSDQPWLKFSTVAIMNNQNPLPDPAGVTEGYIGYIDNGILNESSRRDDLNRIPADKGAVTLRIICDPAEINPGDDPQDDPEIEKTGIYTGYITFSSPNADLSPVRIKVTFIYFRPPLEGQSVDGSKLNGIVLNIGNRDGDSNTLIFGTGDRATTGIDSLFGETPYAFPLLTDQLDARFYPVDDEGNELPNIAPFGIADFASNDEQRKANSRDIRSADDTTRSLIYKVKFNPGPDNKDQRYPIVIEWNVKDFIEGSQAYIRDTQNGQAFAPVNMITQGTVISQNRRSFKIDDPRIREFIIEYTPAKIVEYTDEEGNSIIRPGWNLLSLPVKPLNLESKDVFKNALNKPYYFFLNSYQEEDMLRAGVGYFVKYGPDESLIDKVFLGTTIFEVSPQLNPVRVFVADSGRGGWNTVGAPSTPINVEAIEFRSFNGNETPSKTYTLDHGVWAYKTKRGYYEVSELTPGLGYWIKVNTGGYYYFNTANAKLANTTPPMFAHRNDAKNNATELVISDNNQSSSTLYVSNSANVTLANYELPPVAPSFDVRFEGNTQLTNSNSEIIRLSNVVYPISISAKGLNGTFELSDAVTGEYFGTISSDDMNSVEINNSSDAIKINKIETEETNNLSAVYPNPVVSTANINFNLPEDGNVNISLINSVGTTVSNIFNGNKNAGANTVAFDANGLASGNYYVKIESGSFNKVVRVQIVK